MDGVVSVCCVGGGGVDVKGKGVHLRLECSLFTTLSVGITFILRIAAGKIYVRTPF